ncbi:hypothetical protein [Ochrobactrum soli]|uniref:Uncharacterized protein n=1 Tax=Ochrobactrum soli TaxID=2448455 RepID=A0A849KXT9_9HYPH|nr:hypothetical protein [[Ochrobactrum] soli]NNU62456.1 hypothetical protein [[Ochrobactrum] soli]
MHDDAHFHTEAGFSLPENYRIEDHETTFRVALAIFGCSFASATVLALQIAGLI